MKLEEPLGPALGCQIPCDGSPVPSSSSPAQNVFSPSGVDVPAVLGPGSRREGERLPPAGASGVVTRLPKGFAQELNRHIMTRAAWSRLLSPWKSYQKRLDRLLPEDEVPVGEEPAQAHPLWVQLCRSCQFYSCFNFRAPVQQHINIKELKALLTAEGRHAEHFPSTRCSIGTDSQVVLGAVVKGRSSSRALNWLLQCHIPTLLVYNCCSGQNYVPSADNPADDPTRDRQLRSPVEPPPAWLQAAFRGDFQPLDDFLADQGVSDAVLARLRSFTESALPPDWLESCRKLRRRLFAQQSGRAVNCSARPEKSRAESALFPEAEAGTPNLLASSSQLWMTVNRRPLSGEAKSLLRALPEEYFVFPPGRTAAQRRALMSHPGCLDLFSGSRGLAKALARHVGCWVLTYDIAFDPKQDLLAKPTQEYIEMLVAAKCFVTLTAFELLPRRSTSSPFPEPTARSTAAVAEHETESCRWNRVLPVAGRPCNK